LGCGFAALWHLALLFYKVAAFRQETFSRKKAQKAQEPSRGSGVLFAPFAHFCGHLAGSKLGCGALALGNLWPENSPKKRHFPGLWDSFAFPKISE